jgi:hypothetical protein
MEDVLEFTQDLVECVNNDTKVKGYWYCSTRVCLSLVWTEMK